MKDEPDTTELENRIDKLEATIEKMLPGRRDALKMGGAALVGGAAISGTASAGTNQVGTIGSASQPVDLESEDINNADTVTTQNLVVNGTATGPFGSDLQGCRVFLSSDQTLPQNSRDKIVFDSVVYDDGDNFDTSTHDFTCPETGLYLANLQVLFGGGGIEDYRRVIIGNAAGAKSFGDGSANTSGQTEAGERAGTTTVNKYTQGDTISGYVENDDSSDVLKDSINNFSTFFEVAFLGSL